MIRELAERQHGIVTRRQLIEAGVGSAVIESRLANGQLVRVHRGVYAVGHRRDDLLHRWTAAVLACGDGAVLFRRSAAHLWDLRGSRGPIEVARRSHGPRRDGLRLHQLRSLLPRHVTSERGVPVTTLERTALDLASVLDSRQLERVLVAADRTGHFSWRELRRVIAEGSGCRGVGTLRRVAGLVDPGAVEARSGLEVDFIGICRDGGLPAPQVNVLVEGHLVDFFWPRAGVVVELDSYRYHGDRPAFSRDYWTTFELESVGYRVHRINEEMLSDDPNGVVALIRRSLEAS